MDFSKLLHGFVKIDTVKCVSFARRSRWGWTAPFRYVWFNAEQGSLEIVNHFQTCYPAKYITCVKWSFCQWQSWYSRAILNILIWNEIYRRAGNPWCGMWNLHCKLQCTACTSDLCQLHQIYVYGNKYFNWVWFWNFNINFTLGVLIQCLMYSFTF